MISTWEGTQVSTILSRGMLVGVGVGASVSDVVGCGLRTRGVWEGGSGARVGNVVIG